MIFPSLKPPFSPPIRPGALVEESDQVRSNMHSLFRYDYRDGGNIAETVYRAVKDGELMLVCAGWGGPVSPMVTWQPDISLPAGGRWRVNGGWLYTSSAIESAVAQLNECGVTPDQLCQSDPWGLGALDATLFSTHTRQCQRQAAQGREDDHRLSLPLGASALVAPVLGVCFRRRRRQGGRLPGTLPQDSPGSGPVYRRHHEQCRQYPSLR